MELDPSVDVLVEITVCVSVLLKYSVELSAGGSSVHSFLPELGIEVVNQVDLILVGDFVFTQTFVDTCEGAGCSHVSLHRSLEGSPLSSLSSSSGLGMPLSGLHNGNVMHGDSGDVSVDGSGVNVVLTEINLDPMFGSTRRYFARLREDIAIDLVEDGGPVLLGNTTVPQVSIEQVESSGLLHVTLDSFCHS